MVSKTKVIMLIAFALIIIGGLGGGIIYSSARQLTEVSEVNSIDDSFENIDIQTDKAWLNVRPTEGKTTVIELAGQIHKRASYSFDTKVENGVLTILVNESSGSSWDFMFPAHLSVVISLPEKQYNSLQLEVGGNHGEVHMEEMSIEKIRYKTSSSRIAMEKITAKDIRLETISGEIALRDVNSDRVTTKTYSGKIELNSVEADVIMARATSGQIILSTGHIDRQIDLETYSGEILVQTEQEPENVSFDILSDSGTVNLLKGSFIGGTRIGDGEHLVRLVTKSGSIIIEKERW